MCLGAPAHVLAPGRAFGEWVCQEEGKKQIIFWLGHQVMVYSYPDVSGSGDLELLMPSERQAQNAAKIHQLST